MKRPIKAAMLSLKGIRTDGPMAEDISLENQRRSKDVFSLNVDAHLDRMRMAGNKTDNRVEVN